MKYTFIPQTKCNMCDAETRRVLGRRLNGPQGLFPRSKTGICSTVVQCDCGLIYCDPMPIPENLNDHYSMDPEAYWHDLEVLPNHMKYQLEVAKEVCPDAQTFLDIGAGMGEALRSAEKMGLESYGIEPSETFQMAANHPNISLASVETADFPQMFDIISFNAVLEHLYDPSKNIQKAFKWLKPGGVIYIEVPESKYLITRLFNLYYRLIGTDFVSHISPMHPPYHLYEFTLDSFARNGQSHGYKVATHWRYAGKSLYPRLDKLLTPVMNRTGTGASLNVYLTR